MTNELDYKAINERVKIAVVRQRFMTRLGFFIGSLLCYAGFLLVGFSQFSRDSVSAMFMLAIGGFIGVMFQGISMTLDTKRWEEITRERLLAKEIPREMIRMGLDAAEEHEKVKGVMRLTDDGELEEVVDEASGLSDEMPLKRQR